MTEREIELPAGSNSNSSGGVTERVNGTSKTNRSLLARCIEIIGPGHEILKRATGEGVASRADSPLPNPPRKGEGAGGSKQLRAPRDKAAARFTQFHLAPS